MLYWVIGSKRIKEQNILLLISSYFFYGFWDWRFLLLLISSSLVDFTAGLYLEKTQVTSQRKRILLTSIIWNLGVLFTFKYFNFFIDSFELLFGIESQSGYTFWNVAIPIGLSFYTFQTLSYTIDVYRKEIKATSSLLSFFCFVSFFPQLVAGPIERAKKMMPQFTRQRVFHFQEAKEGLRQILWGLFKKIIVAEKLGVAVDMVFEVPQDYHFATIAYVGILFLMQIYCDFSGYTDIALGTAKLFGFRLSKNFNLPYLSKTLGNFWQRWHITLTRWFTNYVYRPFVSLFNKSKVSNSLSLIITMTLVGFWHGAAWNFLIFGFLNGVFMVMERIPFFNKRKNLIQLLNKQYRWFSIIYMAGIYVVLGLAFRAQNIDQLLSLYTRVFTIETSGIFSSLIGWKIGYLLFMLIAEIWFRKKDFPLQGLEKWLTKPLRWALYYILIFIIINYAEPKEAFIYFQF